MTIRRAEIMLRYLKLLINRQNNKFSITNQIFKIKISLKRFQGTHYTVKAIENMKK